MKALSILAASLFCAFFLYRHVHGSAGIINHFANAASSSSSTRREQEFNHARHVDTRPWESFVFVVPNVLSDIGMKCATISLNFCVMGYHYSSMQTNRSVEALDFFIFGDLLKRQYKYINWFDFNPLAHS
ncbi:uncharacterized protein LOC134848765 [Symsagittifera roscoffensis]|uniref:uncharacterized protein LOC134848765 n=1 Tax=Symsagittifera roscoffensis TaxID=84072 RepID=UPI00307C17E3